MAELLETSEFTLVETPEGQSQGTSEPSHPTPTPRTTRDTAGEQVATNDQLIVLDQWHEERKPACTYDEYTQALQAPEENEGKDISAIKSLPQLMKATLFFQNEELLASSQDRVKATSANDEEFRKFVKYLKYVVSHQGNQIQQEKAQNLLDILNNAALIAKSGETSLNNSNIVFDKLSSIFQETNSYSGDQVDVSYISIELLKEANMCRQQRQACLQNGDLDTAEKCLSDAMEKIEVSVGRAEQQKSLAEKRYTEVARTNRHITVQKFEKEISETLDTEKNKINILMNHCRDDLSRIEKSTNTLDKVYNKSKEHYEKLDEEQNLELRKNKNEQEELEARLLQLRESAKKIDLQRKEAAKHNKTVDKAYQASRDNVINWDEKINRQLNQTQHTSSVIDLIQECAGLITNDFYKVHQTYLSDLNALAVKSLQLYRNCLVGRIVACKFRNQELETNISSLEYMLIPKKEELKQHRKTGLKVMVEKLTQEVRELSDYKHAYMSALQSIEGVLKDAYARLEQVDDAIMKKVPDAKLESVDAIYEEESKQQDDAWENLEMQSLSKNYI
ncbi:hypothetical protein LOD99_10340 [Oopsacas minuta]|uniref:Uncharacterized protein n=1 Tax=Oopsacas minuta TaxID=111878 RepID=A0AAV7KIC5_9METZ|nr:hypothetical protein LOD99_10340 [Oopsacas minuta]